jgi:hypothetical protein
MLAAGSPAASQTINQFVGFGDNTIDSGWYRSAAPNSTNPIYNAEFAIAATQGGGKATTNPGLVSSEFLAGAFGQTAIRPVPWLTHCISRRFSIEKLLCPSTCPSISFGFVPKRRIIARTCQRFCTKGDLVVARPAPQYSLIGTARRCQILSRSASQCRNTGSILVGSANDFDDHQLLYLTFA